VATRSGQAATAVIHAGDLAIRQPLSSQQHHPSSARHPLRRGVRPRRPLQLARSSSPITTGGEVATITDPRFRNRDQCTTSM
jgi:hypothetical protein